MHSETHLGSVKRVTCPVCNGSCSCQECHGEGLIPLRPALHVAPVVNTPRSRHIIEAFLLEMWRDIARLFWEKDSEGVYEYQGASWVTAIVGALAWIILTIAKSEGWPPMASHSYLQLTLVLIAPAATMVLISIFRVARDWLSDVKKRAQSRATRWMD
jgi:hypothetical protein